MMTTEEKAKNEWNADADEYNQWDDLGDDEKTVLIASVIDISSECDKNSQ